MYTQVPSEAINDLLRFQYFMKNFMDTTTAAETQDIDIMTFADSPEDNCYASILLANMLIRTNCRR
jgi:hypothetical protein